MQRNDLSNQAPPLLAFSLERVICENVKSNIWGTKVEINKQHVGAINNLYWTNFKVVYLTFSVPTRRLDKVEEILDNAGCMYHGLIRYEKLEDLLFFFRQHSAAYYYDTDKGLIDRLYPFGFLWQESLVQVWNK